MKVTIYTYGEKCDYCGAEIKEFWWDSIYCSEECAKDATIEEDAAFYLEEG